MEKLHKFTIKDKSEDAVSFELHFHDNYTELTIACIAGNDTIVCSFARGAKESYDLAKIFEQLSSYLHIDYCDEKDKRMQRGVINQLDKD